MGNLTEAFSQIVEKLEKEKGIEPSIEASPSLVTDTFVKESLDLVSLFASVSLIMVTNSFAIVYSYC